MLIRVVASGEENDVPVIMWDAPHDPFDAVPRRESNVARHDEIGLVINVYEEDVLCLIAGKFGWIDSQHLEEIPVH